MYTASQLKRYSLVLSLCIVSALISSCAGPAPTEPPTPIPSQTPTSTITLIPPTLTASYTPIPAPTRTPRPLSRLDPAEFPCVTGVCPSSTTLTQLNALLGEGAEITVDDDKASVRASWMNSGLTFSLREDVIVQIHTMPNSQETELGNMLSVLGTPTEIWYRFVNDPMHYDPNYIAGVELIVLWYPKGVLATYYYWVGTVTQSEVRFCPDEAVWGDIYLWSIADEEPPPVYYWLEERLSEYYVFDLFTERTLDEFTHDFTHGVECFTIYRSVLFDD